MTSASAAAVSLYPAWPEYTSTAVTGTPCSCTNRPGQGQPGSVVMSRDSPGASAVQLTSLVMTDGPAALRNVTDELSRYLDRQGVTARELVGESADAVLTYEEAAVEHRR